MAKTPYEIRLETLQLAFSIVSQRTETPPTTTDIIQEALLLRQFIDNDNISSIVSKYGDERRVFFIDVDLTTEEVKKALDSIMAEKNKEKSKESKAELLEKFKSDGSACCGGTGGAECECNK